MREGEKEVKTRRGAERERKLDSREKMGRHERGKGESCEQKLEVREDEGVYG